ncbi:MAG: hypothetical protein M0Z89_03875 [Nitrospiraceae bacterium]|nr:hypothetical protein [Nitrospiraceae bacterium]
MTIMKKENHSAPVLKPALLLFLIVTLAGCSLLRSGVASLKSTADFRPLEADIRISSMQCPGRGRLQDILRKDAQRKFCNTPKIPLPGDFIIYQS